MAREMEILYSELFEAAGVGRRFGDELAAREGQTQARWQALWTIAHDRTLTVPQVARRIGVSRQSVQRVVDELLADGLLETMTNPDHKTSPLLVLTEHGQKALEGINRAAEEAHRSLMEDFPLSDVQELRRLLVGLTSATRARYDV
jgi:DNA-binding MarR family transcriptional regulator